MDLILIVDTSGSMNDMGKIHLQRNLSRYAVQLREIDQEKYKDLNIRLFLWEQNIYEITMQNDRDVPALTANGSASLNALSNFLSNNPTETEISRFLILSDGNFSNSDIVSFQNRHGAFSDLLIRSVAVGADADLLKLKKISTNNTVYLSENIASAIDSAIFGFDMLRTAPVSVDQILQSALAETGQAEEDWDV
ncbi:hypothetical protein [Shewanella oncorhynchi]|uniref:hypothetical protein n=1 Tax=Shewanella oncorhynchi TaxID=2726434 RepID=UPI003D7B8EDC